MFRVIAAGLLITAGLIGWLYWSQSRPPAFLASGFIEADVIRVVSRVGGRVAEVLVDEGQRVSAQQPLFRIAAFDLDEQLAQAEARVAADQAELDRLVNGYRPQEIARAEAQVALRAAQHDRLVAGPRKQEIAIARAEQTQAEAVLEDARFEYRRVESLAERGDAAENELSQATRQLHVAEARLAAATEQVELLEEGTRPEERAEARAALADAEQALALLRAGYRDEVIAAARARVAAGAAQVAAIRARVDELTVFSPCDCVIEATDLDVGDFVAADAPAVALVDPTSLWVRAYIPEDRLGQVTLGQRVPVRVDSFPDERFDAELRFVAQQAEFTPRNVQTVEERSKLVFRTKVQLLEGHDRLRVGMAADVLFDEADAP